MSVAQLMEGARHPCPGAAPCPPLLHRLITQRPTTAVLLGPEQRRVAVPRLFQIGPELTDQVRVIQQHRASLPALARHRQVFVVGRQGQVMRWAFTTPRNVRPTTTRMIAIPL